MPPVPLGSGGVFFGGGLLKGGELDQTMDGADGEAAAFPDLVIRQALGAQPQNLLPVLRGPFRPPDLGAARPGGDQAGLGPLADQTALELRHGHQNAELQSPDRVVVGGVDSLAGADERHSEPAQLVEDHRQMHERAPDAVELVDDHAVHPAAPHSLHELFPAGPGRRHAGDLVPEDRRRYHAPAAALAILAELAFLRIDGLLVGGNPKIERRSQSHPP